MIERNILFDSKKKNEKGQFEYMEGVAAAEKIFYIPR
jgi:hypothetical protein